MIGRRKVKVVGFNEKIMNSQAGCTRAANPDLPERGHRRQMIIGISLILFLIVPIQQQGVFAGQARETSSLPLSPAGPMVQLAQLATPAQAVPKPQIPLPAPLPKSMGPSALTAENLPAESTPGQGSPSGLTVPRSAAPSGPEGTLRGSKRGQVSLNFDDADVYSVIQTIFANILQANYIIDPRVKGRVTFRSIAPVAQEDVLPLMEVILRLNGIAIVEEAGLYRIIPMSDAPREPAPVGYGRDPQSVQLTGKALLQVIPIRYIKSSEMVKLITPFLSTNAVVVDVPNNNYIIIVDTDSNVRRLLRLIDLFDSEMQREKKPQVFLYHVQNSKVKEMASLLQQIFLGAKAPVDTGPKTPTPPTGPTTPSPTGQTRTPPPAPSQPVSAISSQMTGEALVSESTKIIPDETLNAIVIIATAADYATIKKTIDRIDLAPRQVLFEGIIASVNLKDNLSLGVAWSLKLNAGQLGTSIAFNPAALDPKAAAGRTGFSFWGVDPGGEVRAVINALSKDQQSKVLAAPHILVADNKEAKIQVGKQVPIVTSETYGSSTIAPQRTIQYKDIGIILKVKPRIQEGGLVAVDLYQEISNYETIKLGFNEDTIILNKIDATTTLMVKDNQTIVIGGMIREDTTKSNDGIPLLSKIPVLGYLFGSTEDRVEREEIIILLTPRIVRNPQEADSVTDGYVEKIKTLESGKVEPFKSIQNSLKKDERQEEKPGQKQERTQEGKSGEKPVESKEESKTAAPR